MSSYILFRIEIKQEQPRVVHYNAVFTVGDQPCRVPGSVLQWLGSLDKKSFEKAWPGVAAQFGQHDHHNETGWGLEASTAAEATAEQKALALASTNDQIIAAVQLACLSSLKQYEDPKDPAGSPIPELPLRIL